MTNKNNLEDKIKQFKQKNQKVTKNRINQIHSLSTGAMIGIEIVSGVLIGVIIGTFFDKLFTSKPIFLIICILLGSVASFRTIWLKLKKDSANDSS